MSLGRSTNQNTGASEPSFLTAWPYDSEAASALSRPCSWAIRSFMASTSLLM